MATVSGFAVGYIDVRLHLTDDTGVVQKQFSNDMVTSSLWPRVALVRTSAGRGQVVYGTSSSFILSSGTPQDGWWSGSFRLTSGYDGAFTVGLVQAVDEANNVLSVDPRTQGITRTVQVTGQHIPHLSMGQQPDPVVGVPPGGNGPLTFYGHVTDLDTGAPYPHVTVHMGFDSQCENLRGTQTATTASDGSWRLTVSYWTPDAGCASIFNVIANDQNDPAWYAQPHIAPHYRWPVSASLAKTSIQLGQSTTVNGSTGAKGETVVLDRLVSGAWHQVGSTTVRLSGRFSLVAQPPSRGNHRYRVRLIPSHRGELSSTSRVLLLGVT